MTDEPVDNENDSEPITRADIARGAKVISWLVVIVTALMTALSQAVTMLKDLKEMLR